MSSSASSSEDSLDGGGSGLTEIALIPLKEGKHPDDPDSLPGRTHRDLLDTLLQQKGVQRCCWGRQIENKDTLVWFVDWDSVEDHKNFMNSEYVLNTFNISQVITHSIGHIKIFSTSFSRCLEGHPPCTMPISRPIHLERSVTLLPLSQK